MGKYRIEDLKTIPTLRQVGLKDAKTFEELPVCGRQGNWYTRTYYK